MRSYTTTKPPTKPPKVEFKFNIIERVFQDQESKNLYSTSSETALYLLTDKSKFLVFEKNSTNKNYLQLNLVSYLTKEENKFQTKNYKSQIWTNDSGNHVLVKHEGKLFYYNPYFKRDLNLKEINLEYKSKYYLEPYSIAFDESINSQDEFEILVSDYNSEIYDIKIKFIDKKEIKIDYFEKVHTFKSKFEIEQEENYGQETKNEKTESEKNDNNNDLDLDFDDLNMVSFETGERILDMKIYNNINKNNDKDIEKVIVACTKNMIFQFVGKELTYEELFKKYSQGSENLRKSYRKFPNNSNNLNYNLSHLQILQSYTINNNSKTVFGCYGGYGYCLGEIEENNEKNGNEDKNNLNNIFVLNYKKPKHFEDNKVPLFKIDDNQPNKDLESIMACQSRLFIFVLFDNYLLMISKITQKYVNSYKLPKRYLDMFFNQFNQTLFLYTEKDIYKLSLENEEKAAWEYYIEIGKFDLALSEVPKDDEELRAKIHKIKADYLFKQEKYELAGKEYAFSNESFEHICYKFLREGKYSGLISYLEMIKNYKLNDNNIRTYNNEFFINKYLVYTWLAELLINKENNQSYNDELYLKKIGEEFKYNKKDRYINKENIYYLLKLNGKEKEFNEFAITKNDYQSLIENLLSKGKYDEAFNYLDKNLSNNDVEECTRIFMEYIDIFMEQSVKNSIKILENITFSQNEQKELVRVLIGPNYKEYTEDENNYNLILNYLRKIVKENISNEKQNKNINNLYLLFLSLSKNKDNQKEIVEYLKGPLNTYTINNNHMNISFTNKKVSIDLSFAEKILVNIPPALALVYFFMQKYDESIKVALDNEEYELAIFITQNISNEEKQKKIWIKLFNFFKKNKKYSPKNILEFSNGVINIEDILPFMDDETKLHDIKTDLQECIDVYEEGVSQLKENIITFNKSNNNIQEDIYSINKRKIDLEHSKIKCHECQNTITDNRFFLFPCGHIFDADCLVKIMIEYDVNGIGGEDLNGKVKAIKSWSEKIMNVQKKKTTNKKNIFTEGFHKIGKKTKNTMKKFLTFVKKDQKGKDNSDNQDAILENEKEKEKEKFKDKIDEEVELTKEEELLLKELTNGLYNLLKEECVLCGQYMINSTQIQFSQEDENIKWGKLVVN